MGKRNAPEGVPQFKVVVTQPNGRGPLGPYRLSIAVGFGLLVAGNRIWTSIVDGTGDDGALVTAAVAAWFAWIVTTVISKILGTVEVSQPGPVSQGQRGAPGPTEASLTPPSMQGT